MKFSFVSYQLFGKLYFQIDVLYHRYIAPVIYPDLNIDCGSSVSESLQPHCTATLRTSLNEVVASFLKIFNPFGRKAVCQVQLHIDLNSSFNFIHFNSDSITYEIGLIPFSYCIPFTFLSRLPLVSTSSYFTSSHRFSPSDVPFTSILFVSYAKFVWTRAWGSK